MTEAGGGCDGATVDAEGGVWSAPVCVGKVVRYLPDGTVERLIEMPVEKVTSCIFGGPDLDIFYVAAMAKPPCPASQATACSAAPCSRSAIWA